MFRVGFTHTGPNVPARQHLIKFKITIASATNLVYKVHSSLSHNLNTFQIQHGDEWVEYDMPWVNSHAAVKKRINELVAFHEVFYGETA